MWRAPTKDLARCPLLDLAHTTAEDETTDEADIDRHAHVCKNGWLTLLATATSAVHHRCITRAPVGALLQKRRFHGGRMVKLIGPTERTGARREKSLQIGNSE